MDQDSAGFWTEVEEVFAKAVELPHPARAAFLAEACHARPAVRRELEALLEAHEQAGGFLTSPAIHARPMSARPSVGHAIGPFRLVKRIGAGGMGTVYRAERMEGFAQTVAIKLIDARLNDPETVRRFRSERHILATLNHPHIVRLLDGRIDDGQQPYLVMEYIDGLPITQYCETHHLSLKQRLRLFCDVCAAVHEAHEHGIVHRDLKPANILVTADGAPKLLDYGVAKLLTSVAHETDATLPGVLQPLTPNYASPEQFRGLPVTTAADIYALGVLLFEIVAGGRPYETAGKPVDDMLRIVLEQEPARPSASLSPAVPYTPRPVKGDIDAIVSMAMHKEASRRYASSRELAADIERHLGRRPVLAREPGLWYVATRLARRHRTAFVAAGIVALALVATAAISLWHVRIAVRERNRATARFDDVRHLANTLIFKIHDQVTLLPGSTAVRREIVSEALAYLEKLAGDPAGGDGLRLELAKGYHRIGTVQGAPSFANLGDREGALESFRRAAVLLHSAAGLTAEARPALVELARVQLSIAAVANIAGHREMAITAARDAVSHAERLVQASSGDDARRLLGSAYFQLASVSEDDPLPHWQRAGAVFDAMLAERPDDVDRQRNVALVEKYTGAVYERAGNYGTALQHHMRAHALDQKRLARAPVDRTAQFDVAIDLGNIAHAQANTGQLREAVSGYQASLKLRQALADSDPRDILARGRVAYAHNQLSNVYVRLGNTAPAVEHAASAVAIGETMMAVDPLHGQSYVTALHGLAVSRRAAGQRAAACATFSKALAVIGELGKRSDWTNPTAARVREEIDAGTEACR
jgi:non-specific serine/threonine protein kinase/serine/threonine-protein kinase